MVKKLFTLFLLGLFLTANAGERVLIHIGKDGKQEAILLQKGEKAQDAIQRIEKSRASLITSAATAGTIDSLKYYPGVAKEPGTSVLNTNFGWTHQDIALQWWTAEAAGTIKEFWWRNYNARGNINKGTVRGWHVDPRLATRPAATITRYMGYYKDPTDGDGLVTPFKPATGDQYFYGNGLADSATWRIDPLGTEAAWLAGGLQVTLDSNVWQGVKLEDWGDSMNVKLGEMFGFTLSNDTKLSDIPSGGTDARLEILSWANANPAPFHSYKWYEVGRAVLTGNPPTRDAGWHLRGDYEWGMFVVLEYTGDRPPKVTLPTLLTTLSTSPRPITATITDDNPGGGPAGVQVARLFTKKGALATYDSVAMSGTGSSYTANAPAASPGDTIYWYVVATDVNGNRSTPAVRTYKSFKKNNPNLLLYNNAAYSEGNARIIYLGGSAATVPGYDFWSAPNDGIGELGDALDLYNHVVLGEGAFPSRNIYASVEAWLKKGTASAKKNLFFASQDYGCIVDADCADITFTAGQWQYDILGIEKLGPQDIMGSTAAQVQRPLRIVPQVDTLTNYLIKYNTDSSTTLYYHPYYELTISSYPDALTPKSGAKALFKNHDGSQTLAVWNSTAGTNTAFFGFDASYTMQFRSDTSKTPPNDPKYRRVNSVKALAKHFVDITTSVAPISNVVPSEFSLGQNYPNPFNPTTSIEYSVPVRSNVEISIFNILGQKVATIMNDVHEAGTHRATWNGKDQFGKSVASGIYFYQMRAGSFEQVKKMMLMK